MSSASQFFPNVTAASGFIIAEVFIAAGGGGGGGFLPGTAQEGSGSGGGGGVFYGYLPLAPGSTNPITVGGGGAGGLAFPSPTNAGTKGSNSSITSSTTTLNVVGGGGGGGTNAPGGPGGSGGGGAYSTGLVIAVPGGYSVYAGPHGTGVAPYTTTPGSTPGVIINAFGRFFGNPGTGGSGSPLNISGYSGGALGAGPGSGFYTDITGTLTSYGSGQLLSVAGTSGGSNTGDGGVRGAPPSPTGGSGGSGIVVIKYPTQFAAATSFPGATDISPSTPGFRTYKFTSPGSITLP